MSSELHPLNKLTLKTTACLALAMASQTAIAAENPLVIRFDLGASDAAISDSEADGVGQDAQEPAGPLPAASSGPPPGAGPGAPTPAAPGFQIPKIVFDETWVSLGIGAGLVPSYGGSDDYVVFPLPLIVGRVGGVGISPNGPGFVLNLNSPKPSLAPPQGRFSFGPAFRIRNDRVNQIEDAVVEQLEDLDLAVEVGANVGYSFPGVFKNRDALTLSTQVRWDVAGAHDGMLIEPSIGYRTLIGRSTALQVNANLQFVDDSFADYYYSVTPDQSAASGLPGFTADGGLNSVDTIAILNFDLDGNAINGGLNIYTVLGYSRLVGDAADTPFTSVRGSANQFIGGVGIGYTF